MNWLLGKFTDNPMLILWVGLAAFATGAISGGGAAWTFQGFRLDAVEAEYAGFVATTNAIGKAAKDAAEKQAKDDQRKKELADEEHARTVARYVADIKRLRDANSARSFVPPAGAASLRPERACFDRAELEFALRGFAERTQGLFDEGSKAVIDLDTAKIWAKGYPR